MQGQCEPPDDDRWFQRMQAAGIDTLGMHLEAVTPSRARAHHAGQGQVPVARYLSAFEAAVAVFGRGQVSTYILAGLGDTREEILAMCERLVALGVYPFVVPFVPISGTPLEDHPAPDAGVHASDPRAAGRDGGGGRHAVAATSRPAAASAAPARRCRSTRR